jgi:hypothetical protein
MASGRGGERTVSLDRNFDQERRPVFTLVSCVTTLIVSATLIIVNTAHYQDWSALLKLPLTYGPLFLGVLTNFFAGVMAYSREENWGGRIGAAGIAICVLTWLVLHQRGIAP